MIIVKKDNLYGMINGQGEMIIEAKYENIRNFSNGFAAVCKDNKWGYIDQNGKQVIDYLYSSARDFSIHGLVAVKLSGDGGSWGLMRKNGQLINRENDNKYYFIDEFNPEGYAVVGTRRGYEIIDIEGNHIGNRVYRSLKYIPEQNIFIGDVLGKSCLINIEGQVIVDAEVDYDEIYYPSNGLCQVSKDGKSGYIDENGRLAIPLKYEGTYEFSDNGLAFVLCENGLGGYINKDDEFVIQPTLESGSTFEFGLAAVSKNEEYIFIYENGNKAINKTFKYASGFSECGLAKTELFNGQHELIRPDSSIAIRLKKGCELEEFIGDSKVTKFRVDGREALINSKGKIITGLNYDEIRISPYSNLNPFLRNGLWGYLNDEGYEVIANRYIMASEFTEHNLAKVGTYSPIENKVKSLYINDKDNIIDDKLMDSFNQSFTDKYSEVYGFMKGVSLAIKKVKPIIINAYGKEILPRKFALTVKNDRLVIDKLEEKSEKILETYEDYSNDEFEGSYNQDESTEDTDYELIIRLKGDWTTEGASKFIEEKFPKEDIIEVKNSVIKILWKMPYWGSGGDIEVEMYYLLENSKLGEYSYRKLD